MKKIIFVAYGLVLLGFTLFSYAFVDPNLFYLKKIYSGFAFQYRGVATILYLLSIVLFSIFYLLFLWLLKKKVLTISSIKWLIGISSFFLLFSYPAMLSYDIFNYTATAKVLFFYHENPYLFMPIEFISDPLLLFTHAANKIALYGPVWIILTGLPYFFGFGNFLLNILSLKLLIGVFYLEMIFLIWKLSKNIFSTVLFALNPLVIIETLVSGHNDTAMMFFALFSFFLLTKKKLFLGALFLIFSILIKYATLALVPLFLYGTWKILQKQTVDWEKIWYFSAWAMFIAFLLSPIREEIYPWYAIWFLPFIALIPKKRLLLFISLALSFGLLLRYIPFMLLGTHFGVTPFIKAFVTFAPAFLVLLYFFVKEKLWLKVPFFH